MTCDGVSCHFHTALIGNLGLAPARALHILVASFASRDDKLDIGACDGASMLNVFAALRRRLRFSAPYFTWTCVVLATELFIALAVDDGFVRPYAGDTLAVVLLYVALLSVLDVRQVHAALGALAIAWLVELGQYLHIVDRLGLADVTIARVVLGTFGDVHDLVAYTAALPLIALVERFADRSA
jgi:hypothetical protein